MSFFSRLISMQDPIFTQIEMINCFNIEDSSSILKKGIILDNLNNALITEAKYIDLFEPNNEEFMLTFEVDKIVNSTSNTNYDVMFPNTGVIYQNSIRQQNVFKSTPGISIYNSIENGIANKKVTVNCNYWTGNGVQTGLTLYFDHKLIVEKTIKDGQSTLTIHTDRDQEQSINVTPVPSLVYPPTYISIGYQPNGRTIDNHTKTSECESIGSLKIHRYTIGDINTFKETFFKKPYDFSNYVSEHSGVTLIEGPRTDYDLSTISTSSYGLTAYNDGNVNIGQESTDVNQISFIEIRDPAFNSTSYSDSTGSHGKLFTYGMQRVTGSYNQNHDKQPYVYVETRGLTIEHKCDPPQVELGVVAYNVNNPVNILPVQYGGPIAGSVLNNLKLYKVGDWFRGVLIQTSTSDSGIHLIGSAGKQYCEMSNIHFNLVGITTGNVRYKNMSYNVYNANYAADAYVVLHTYNFTNGTPIGDLIPKDFFGTDVLYELKNQPIDRATEFKTDAIRSKQSTYVVSLVFTNGSAEDMLNLTQNTSDPMIWNCIAERCNVPSTGKLGSTDSHYPGPSIGIITTTNKPTLNGQIVMSVENGTNTPIVTESSFGKKYAIISVWDHGTLTCYVYNPTTQAWDSTTLTMTYDYTGGDYIHIAEHKGKDYHWIGTIHLCKIYDQCRDLDSIKNEALNVYNL